MIKNTMILAVICLLGACAGPQVTRVQQLSDSADAPYKNVLVISLFKSFDSRRYLEQDIVKELTERGVTAIASTSLMNTKTPVNRETFLAMVDAHGSDAVLVTQLMSLDTKTKVVDASPEATYKISPTYYFNVWEVNLMEFVGPQDLRLKHELILATQMFSVKSQEPIWAIESKTKLTSNYNTRGDTSFIADEANAIANHLSRDGLLAP